MPPEPNDLTLSNLDEMRAVIAVLERKGLLTRQEVAEEIKEMKKWSDPFREAEALSFIRKVLHYILKQP